MEQDNLIRSDTSLKYSQHNVINLLENKIEYLEKENKMIKNGLSNPEMSIKQINKTIKNPIRTFNNQNDQISSSINYNLHFSNIGVFTLCFYIHVVIFVCLFGFIIKLIKLI